jgi:hypothetical protein
VVLNGDKKRVLRKYGVADRERVPVPSFPDLLIKQDNKLMLLNTKMPKEEGLILYCLTAGPIHAIRELAAGKGVECPVFSAGKRYAWGNDVYRMRETPYYVEGCRLYR